MMVYMVHLSVLLILFGALLGSIFGYKGFMNLSEGESSAEVVLYQGDHAVMLPFEVRCDKFTVSFYDNGMPKEYRSDLSIVERGKEVYKQAVLVNDPMTFDGVTFYQASYGTTLKQADVEFQDRDKGKTFKLTLPFKQTVSIPESRDKVQIFDYRENMGRMGAAMVMVLFREGEDPQGSWILVDKPDFHGNRVQNYQIKVLRTEKSNYTGLQVKRDPGVWVVWFGFMAMLVGIGMTFCLSHRRIWIWCGPSPAAPGSCKTLLAGRTSKNPLAFEREFNEICGRIEERLKSVKIGNQGHDQ
jgi:cytochrome c biogenesis protein